MTKLFFYITWSKKDDYYCFSHSYTYIPAHIPFKDGFPHYTKVNGLLAGYLLFSAIVKNIKILPIKLSLLSFFLFISSYGFAQLEPGNIGAVAVNIEDDSTNNDQISLAIFDTIPSGMTLEITDNGWQQTYQEKWGNQEGVISLTRTGPAINPGFVFTIKGTGNQVGDFTMFPDSNNWSVDTVHGNFDLTMDDQFWVLQGGVWNKGPSTDKATYDGGNIITGWSAPYWTNTYVDDLKNSDVYPNMNCLVFSFDANVKKQKLKYKGSRHLASKREWISRITDFNNWKDFNSTQSYENATPKYIYGDTLKVSSDSIKEGIWYGDKNNNWFDCKNWSNFQVPDKTSDVYLNDKAQRYLEIDTNAEYSHFFNDSAKCKNIRIQKDSLILQNDYDILDIYGDIFINGGKLYPNAGQIALRGNWENIDTAGFIQDSSTVKFYGNGQQLIKNDQAKEKYNNLRIEKPAGDKVKLESNVQTQMLNLVSGHVLLDTFNLIVQDSIEGGSQGSYCITKNDHASGGYLFMRPAKMETLYPIGTLNEYTPVFLTNSKEENFKVRTFDGIRENGYSGNALSGDIVNRTWAIELVSADSTDANIKLQWNKSVETTGFSNNRSNGIMIYNPGTGSGNNWNDWSMLFPESTTPAGTNPYAIKSFNNKKFGLFAVYNRCYYIKTNTSKIYHY